MKRKTIQCPTCLRRFKKPWQVAQHYRKHPEHRVTTTNGRGPDEAFVNNHVSYAFGHIEAWIGIYSRSTGIPEAVLAHRVAGLLHRSTRGAVLGA